jgi:hypothetical protein
MECPGSIPNFVHELLSDYEKWIWIIDWGSPQHIIYAHD